LYLIYERRYGLAKLRPEPAWWGLLGMAAMGAVWLVADAIDVSVGRHFAVVGMLQALIFSVLGWRVYWFLLFPLLFLWLLVPAGEFLLPVLQNIAMRLSVIGLELTGIPIFAEGFSIETPTGSFVVAPGCAGGLPPLNGPV
jgi:exosortase